MTYPNLVQFFFYHPNRSPPSLGVCISVKTRKSNNFKSAYSWIILIFLDRHLFCFFSFLFVSGGERLRPMDEKVWNKLLEVKGKKRWTRGLGAGIAGFFLHLASPPGFLKALRMSEREGWRIIYVDGILQPKKKVVNRNHHYKQAKLERGLVVLVTSHHLFIPVLVKVSI